MTPLPGQSGGAAAGAKARLRREMRGSLRALATAEVHAWSSAIADRLRASEALSQARSVAIYTPLRGEPDLRALFVNDEERRWYLPRVKGEGLEFALAPPGLLTLNRGAHGVLEPPASALLLDEAHLDVVIVPGLAFDAAGGRLGRGAGCYDRWLDGLPGQVRKIGVCFECQIVENVPRELHDAHMDVIVTERRFGLAGGVRERRSEPRA